MSDSARRPLIVVILLAALIRGGVLWWAGDLLAEDPDAYRRIATTLAASGTFGTADDDGSVSPTAFRPPLYPAVLAGIYSAIIAIGNAFGDPPDGEKAFRMIVGVLHWVLGTMTAALAFCAARRLIPETGSVRRIRFPAAAAAGLLVAVDPILVQAGVLVMTETAAAALAAAALLAWVVAVDALAGRSRPVERVLTRRDGLREQAIGWALAAILGAAFLCRPTFVVWTALLVLYLGILAVAAGAMAQPGIHRRRTRAFQRGSLGLIAKIVGVSAVVIGGWTLRNHHHFDRPIWATTHGGYTLLLGNNPYFYDYLRTAPRGVAWDAEPFFERWEMRRRADPTRDEFWDPRVRPRDDADWRSRRSAPGDEVAEDRLAYSAATAAIRSDPGGFVRASLNRIDRLHSPLPLQTGEPDRKRRAAVAAFYCILYLMIAVGLWRQGKRLLRPEWAALWLLWASLVAVHFFYWTDMRMRAPLMPAMAVIAAAALAPRAEERRES